MISEELSEKQSQDKVMTARKKFFDWGDMVAIAKMFPNDSREKDIFVIEILSNKLTK